MLMKETYFYKKNDLIRRINTPKEYPRSQIYAALTQLIEDKNELVYDKYGRDGRLVNIGDYYLFQPIEIDSDISLFNRERPIDYKHKAIRIKLKSGVANVDGIVVDATAETATATAMNNNTLNDIRENYAVAMEYLAEGGVLNRAEPNYYKRVGYVLKKFIDDEGLEVNDVREFIIADMIDKLLFPVKLELLKEVWGDGDAADEVLGMVRNYFETKMVNTARRTGLPLFDAEIKKEKPKAIIYVVKDRSTIVKATPSEERDIIKEISTRYTISPDDCNIIFGFLALNTDNTQIVFKLKDLSGKRNVGIVCQGKAEALRFCRLLFGADKFTKENTKLLTEKDLCIYISYYLRYNNKIRRDGKSWFLDLETARFNGV
jgi:hypothetical protein